MSGPEPKGSGIETSRILLQSRGNIESGVPVQPIMKIDEDHPTSHKAKNRLLPVTPPLSSKKLSSVIYFLCSLAAILLAFYFYSIFRIKGTERGRENLDPIRCSREPGAQPITSVIPTISDDLQQFSGKGGYSGLKHSHGASVEDSITALAEALGISPSADFREAVVVAVRNFVPSASLISLATRETGPVVNSIVKGIVYEHIKIPPARAGGTALSQPTGVIHRIFRRIGTIFGAEEQ